MLKNALYTVNPPRVSTGLAFCGYLPARDFHRYLSTNSAINKGLRKSKNGRSRLDPPARLGGVTRRTEPSRRFDDSRYGRTGFNPRDARTSEYGKGSDDLRHSRPPRSRPSDDREPSVTTRKRSLTLNERQTFKAIDGNYASQSRRGPAGDNPGRFHKSNPKFSFPLRRQHQIKQQGGKAMAEGTSLNRAERRAVAFGHKKKPPEGYKALPIVSEEQGNQPPQEFDNRRAGKRQRLSSGWQAKYDSGFNTTDYRDEKRWADRPARRGDGLDGSGGRGTEAIDERPPRKSNAPLAIPYTTPASEFLYGHSVVSAALKFSRRKFYKLYLYNGASAEVRGQDREVRKLALAANMEVTRVGNDWLKLMDKMSGGRPHNVRRYLAQPNTEQADGLSLAGLYSRSLAFAEITSDESATGSGSTISLRSRPEPSISRRRSGEWHWSDNQVRNRLSPLPIPHASRRYCKLTEQDMGCVP